MSPVILRYPLDPTGVSLNNKVQNEVHQMVRRNNRAIIPTYGAFFTESLVVTDTATNRILVNVTDYSAVELYEVPTAKFGKEVCAVILITNPTVSDQVSITYQAVGGDFSTNFPAVMSMVEALSIDDRPLSWPSIIDLPSEFPPSHHLHDAGDIYGFEYLVHACERIREALILGNVEADDRLYAYVDALMAFHLASPNPHPMYPLRDEVSSLVAAVRKPVLVSPVLGAVVNAGQVFTGSTYYSLYSVPMGGAQFQVSKQITFASQIVMDQTLTGTSITYTNPTAFENGAVLFGRVRYKDIENVWSAWSSPIQFSGAVPPAVGTILATHCTGVDKYNTVANGTGGSTEVLVQANSTDCGYVPPPASGTVLDTFCSGYNKVNRVANGSGGYNDVVVETNSTTCGYVPPVVYPPAGTELSVFCSGYTKYRRVADGSGGYTDQVIATNSTDCGYVAPPASGTILATHCVGFNKYNTVANGSGGSTEVLLESNSAYCGYTPPPPAAGTVLASYCTGFNLYHTVANGSGGSYESLIETNSTTCGYVAPPAAGTYVSTFCSGVNRYNTYANGSGGTYDTLIEQNSTSCGYVSPFNGITSIPANLSAGRSTGPARVNFIMNTDGTWTSQIVGSSTVNQSGRYLTNTAAGLEVYIDANWQYGDSNDGSSATCNLYTNTWQAMAQLNILVGDGTSSGNGIGVIYTISLREQNNPSSSATFQIYIQADGNCFAVGTMLRTASGDRAVETLKVGDDVIGFTEPTMIDSSVDNWDSWTVSNLNKLDTAATTTVVANNQFTSNASIKINNLHTTLTHAYFVFDGTVYRWKLAKDIVATDKLVDSNKNLVSITSIEQVSVPTVFVALNVEQADTLQVRSGSIYILAHNVS
jgi:hypothetical protein